MEVKSLDFRGKVTLPYKSKATLPDNIRSEAMKPKLLASALLAASLGSAVAQPFPARPITIVVPVAAGASTDTLARLLSERMKVSLGQPIIVENTTGAGGSIGVARVARSAPDGYTLS